MSHIFDFSKKSLAHIGAVSPDFDGTGATSSEKSMELRQVLAETVYVNPASRIVFHTAPRSAAADRFRLLRMRLRTIWNAGKLKSLLITSPQPRDGKTTVALNLATALAEGGKKNVLLIDADLHHPSITERLGLHPRPGFAECLESGLNPLSALKCIEPLGWYLLQSGNPQGNPTELLQNEAVSRTLHSLSPHFDWVLVDAPPVCPLTDAVSLSHQLNASLLVAREGQTPREGLDQAISLLGRERVLGIILNGVEGLDQLYSGYYGAGANR